MVNFNLALRTVQTVLVLSILALNGYVTYWYTTHTTVASAPAATITPTVIGALSILALIYLFFNAPLQISQGHRTSNPRFFNKWAVLAIDALFAALWFGAAAQEAAFRANLHLCFGRICGCILAASVMGMTTGILFVITTVLAAIHVNRTRIGNAALSQPRQTHAEWVGVIDPEKIGTAA